MLVRWSTIVCTQWGGGCGCEVFKPWSKKWQTCLRKTTSPKKGHQKNNPPKTTHFTIFYHIFTQFYHFLYFAALWSPRDHVVAPIPRA